MKFGVLNKLTTVNRFVLHTLQRNITHLAVITRKTNIKLDILKGGNWKRAKIRAEQKLQNKKIQKIKGVTGKEPSAIYISKNLFK